MKIRLFIILVVLIFINSIQAFSIWAGSAKFGKLANTTPLTIYIDTLCFVGAPLTLNDVSNVAASFAPGTFVTSATTFNPIVKVIKSAAEYPSGNYDLIRENTVLIVRDSIKLHPEWAMSGGQTYSKKAIKITFNKLKLPSDYTKSALLHEFGHGVGLGHSSVRSHVMYDTDVGNYSLTSDEIYGIYSQYAPAQFTFEDTIKVLSGDNRIKLKFNKLIGVENYKAELWYDDGNENNTEKINNDITLSKNTETNYDWNWEALNLGSYRVKVYVRDTEDCKGKAHTLNLSRRDEPTHKEPIEVYSLELKTPPKDTTIIAKRFSNIYLKLTKKDKSGKSLSLFGINGLSDMIVRYELWRKCWKGDEMFSRSIDQTPETPFNWQFNDGYNGTIDMPKEPSDDFYIKAFLLSGVKSKELKKVAMACSEYFKIKPFVTTQVTESGINPNKGQFNNFISDSLTITSFITKPNGLPHLLDSLALFCDGTLLNLQHQKPNLNKIFSQWGTQDMTGGAHVLESKFYYRDYLGNDQNSVPHYSETRTVTKKDTINLSKCNLVNSFRFC